MTLILHKMTSADKRFYKYLTVGEEDKHWGIYVTGAGHIQIPPNTEYPLVDDPSHHYFHWAVGRRISEYQILYITRGQGTFESERSGSCRIGTGDAFILFPGIWHRFRPDESTGWDEYWVEFDGNLIRHYHDRDFLSPENPVIKAGIEEAIAKNYLSIIKLIRDEKPGFQYIASGMLLQIVGQLMAFKKYQVFEGRNIETQIRQAKLFIMENLHLSISQEDLAKKIGLGYSLYRKKFREYTGVPPAQYHIQLRINKAKDLLITTSESFKELALELGFESTDYFFRLFRQKTGFTPSEFREKNKR